MVQAVIATTVTGLQGRGVANTAPTNNQALVWNGSAWAPAGPFLTAAGAPYIATNYVDNSGFTINQRGVSSGTALAAGAYGFDRWKAGASGCTLTFTASPGSTVVTITAGTVQQVIEGVSQINSNYVLSWLGSATGRVNTGAYVASPISFTGAPNTNVTIEFQGGTLGQVQLQIGTQATLWQPTPVANELTRCMRFYQILNCDIAGFAQTGGNFGQKMTFLTQMRAAPTMIPLVAGAPNNASGALYDTVSANSFRFLATIVSGAVGAFWTGAVVGASADL